MQLVLESEENQTRNNNEVEELLKIIAMNGVKVHDMSDISSK